MNPINKSPFLPLNNNRGFGLIQVALMILLIPTLVLIATQQFSITQKSAALQHSTASKSNMVSIKNWLISTGTDPDGDGNTELLKEGASNSLPPSIPIRNTDDYGGQIRYYTWDLGTPNSTDATHSQNNTAPPLTNLIGRIISAGKDGVFSTTNTSTTAQGDDIVIDIFNSDVASNTDNSGWKEDAIANTVTLKNPARWVGINAPTPVSPLTVGNALYTAINPTLVGNQSNISDQPTALAGTTAAMHIVDQANSAGNSAAQNYGLFIESLTPIGSALNYGLQTGIRIIADHNSTGTVSNVLGLYANANNRSTGTIIQQLASYGYAANSSTGAITTQYGGAFAAINVSGGAIGTSYGTQGYVRNGSTGTISTAYGVQSFINNISTGTIGTAYGVAIGSPTQAAIINPLGTVTTGYGLYIGAVQATNKWSIYQADATAPNYFAGNVGINNNAPDAPLTIGDDTVNQGYIRLHGPGGNVGNIYHDTTNGIHIDTASNALPIQIDGSKVILGMTSNVGIGTTTPNLTNKLEVHGTTAIGQYTNGTAVIDAFGGNAYFGTNTVTNGIAINALGNVTAIGTITATQFNGSGAGLTANSIPITALTAGDYSSKITSGSYNIRAYPRKADGGDLNFNWSGQVGQPTWLWGGTDGVNMYVYNPSNFSVNYATSAGNADTTDGYHMNQNVLTTSSPSFAGVIVGSGPGTGVFNGGADAAGYGRNNIELTSWYGIGFRSSLDNTTRIYMNPRDGSMGLTGQVTASQFNGPLNGNAATASEVSMSSGRTDPTAYPVLWGTTGATSQLYSASAVTIQSSTGTLNATNLTATGLTSTNGITSTGTGQFTGANYFNSNRGAGSYLGTQNTSPGLTVASTDGGTAFMSFLRNGLYAVNMGLDPDNVLRIGGWSASANRWQLDMNGNNTIAGNLVAGGTGTFGASAIIGTNVPAGYYQDANNGAYRSLNVGGDTGYYFQSYNGATTAAYIGLQGTYAGKVGIGTTTPAEKLDVTGNIKASGATPYLQLNPTGWNTFIEAGVNAINTAVGNFTAFINPLGRGFTFIINGVSKLFIQDTTGNVGINTTNPAATLDVNGTAKLGAAGFQWTVDITGNVINPGNLSVGGLLTVGASGIKFPGNPTAQTEPYIASSITAFRTHTFNISGYPGAADLMQGQGIVTSNKFTGILWLNSRPNEGSYVFRCGSDPGCAWNSTYNIGYGGYYFSVIVSSLPITGLTSY